MNSFHRFRKAIAILVIVLTMMIGWLLTTEMSVQAQSRTTAHITVDGRQLFELSEAGQFSAENRAADANLILREAVRSPGGVKVEIVQTNQLPVILVNNRHLLTVTQEDTFTGRTKQEQAEIWAQRIREAVAQGQEERRLDYFWRAILLIALSVLGAIALHLLLGWVGRYWLQRLVPREANHPETGAQPKGIELFLQLTLVIVRSLLWIGITIYITDLFPLTREWSRNIANILWMSLTSPVITIGESSYSVINIIIFISLFFGVLAIAGTLTNLLRSRVLRMTNVSRGVQESIAIAIHYSLIFIGTVLLLQIWGLDISSLAILASVFGVAIGFGLQGVAKELVSGFVITFERAIEIGDFVQIGEFMGTVERLNARSTYLRTLDDIVVIVPNSRLLDTEVVNWNHRASASRLVLPVRVAYGVSINTIRSALLEVAVTNPDILKKPNPTVWFQGYGEDFLNFQLLVWISKPRKQFQIKSDLYFKIDEILRQKNINIPLPQRSLHLRTGSLPIELSPQLENSLSQLSQGLITFLKSQLPKDSANGANNSSAKTQSEKSDSE
ncbi:MULTISPECIES: mechanosensitive ion channel family protein [Nostoc]|uniref:Mechanosensitive ion channel n=2 Tax=Nostoc TaxID=1177 RepID=A0ABR8I8Q9_9NOSO|nr:MULTISPECIES: mechanosensitive ion channel domain-containing protein [Nostoc]MBD2563994.1 mechanosensitive ion channel [Nostoc linckia FACHB-391]MBD2648031.1 mechanosensitive ion channel [Nostoc foliaceum FACHB-393]